MKLLIFLAFTLIVPQAWAAKDPSACNDGLSKKAEALAAKLVRKGYDESIAKRLVQREPGLADMLVKRKKGGPLTYYRGFAIHPYEFNSAHISKINPGVENAGNLVDATNYSNSPRYTGENKEPLPPGENKDLTFVVEMQIPELAVHGEVGRWIEYERALVTDDTLFIRRVGIRDWAEATTFSNPYLGEVSECPIHWVPYDDVFDENGHIIRRPDW